MKVCPGGYGYNIEVAAFLSRLVKNIDTSALANFQKNLLLTKQLDF